jgi:hypothetical protein
MIALISERTEDEWVYADTQKVDLLLVGRRSGEGAEVGDRVGSVLACLAENEESVTGPSSLTVVRPLRFMPFMELLQEASKHLAAMQPAAEEQMEVDSGPGLGHLELASALQDLRIDATSPIVALVSKSGKTLATLNFQCMAITSAFKLPTLLRLLHTRVSRIDERGELAWQSSCEQTRKIPLETFFWNLGRDMGIYHGLAPWLQMDEPVQLNGWPDFGEIKATQDEIKLCALLSRGSLTPSQLKSQSKIDSVQVNGFLSSASLCDLLALALKDQPSAAHLKTSSRDAPDMALLGGGRQALATTESQHEVNASAATAPQVALAARPFTAAEIPAIDTSDTSLLYKLKRWPPTETLAKDAVRIRIATILSRRSISIEELVSLSRVELNVCGAFLQTLAQSQLIAIDKQAAEIPIAPHNLAAQKSSSLNRGGMKGAITLIQSIRRRFGLL